MRILKPKKTSWKKKIVASWSKLNVDFEEISKNPFSFREKHDQNHTWSVFKAVNFSGQKYKF